MKQFTRLVPIALLILAGCTGDDTDDQPATTTVPDITQITPATTTGGGSPAAPTQFSSSIAIEGLTAIPLDRGDAMISPENATITFIGTKPGDNPEPKNGWFEKFSGAARMNPATNTISMVFVQIQTDSLSTEIEKLTEHLKGPDFFEVREHGTASFRSMSITPGETPGEANVSGELTLHGKTKPISFTAKMQADASGFAMQSEFTIDRTEFGIDYGADEISHDVTISVTIGTLAEEKAAGDGEEEPVGQGSGGGQFDPEARFAAADTNNDGKLSPDEIPDRMKRIVEQVDKNSDGEVTKEEYTEFVAAFRNGAGRPGSSGGGPVDTPVPEE